MTSEARFVIRLRPPAVANEAEATTWELRLACQSARRQWPWALPLRAQPGEQPPVRVRKRCAHAHSAGRRAQCTVDVVGRASDPRAPRSRGSCAIHLEGVPPGGSGSEEEEEGSGVTRAFRLGEAETQHSALWKGVVAALCAALDAGYDAVHLVVPLAGVVEQVRAARAALQGRNGARLRRYLNRNRASLLRSALGMRRSCL